MPFVCVENPTKNIAFQFECCNTQQDGEQFSKNVLTNVKSNPNRTEISRARRNNSFTEYVNWGGKIPQTDNAKR